MASMESTASEGLKRNYDDIRWEYGKEFKIEIDLKTMGSGEALKAAKVYRELMKTAKKHIAKEEHKAHFRDFIKSEFRKNGDGLEPSFIQQKIKLARDYTYLLNSVHHHQDLLFTYNIAVDRSDEMKKVLGKSAASVGLQLPEASEALADRLSNSLYLLRVKDMVKERSPDSDLARLTASLREAPLPSHVSA
ncbi:hypothetical protein E3N88_01181 [Mikania micrantha]|uniref:Uncharacterized protein n=1 Tax=Mikania micrantha TaxID=192012 RepID=A0A5N6Q095_9ASTR|nr:hypothetical protein E3N88_01181 [Mikania micrantha]